jgi:hypothetical protein
MTWTSAHTMTDVVIHDNALALLQVLQALAKAGYVVKVQMDLTGTLAVERQAATSDNGSQVMGGIRSSSSDSQRA